jgi:hypothetical protein
MEMEKKWKLSKVKKKSRWVLIIKKLKAKRKPNQKKKLKIGRKAKIKNQI